MIQEIYENTLTIYVQYNDKIFTHNANQNMSLSDFKERFFGHIIIKNDEESIFQYKSNGFNQDIDIIDQETLLSDLTNFRLKLSIKKKLLNNKKIYNVMDQKIFRIKLFKILGILNYCSIQSDQDKMIVQKVNEQQQLEQTIQKIMQDESFYNNFTSIAALFGDGKTYIIKNGFNSNIVKYKNKMRYKIQKIDLIFEQFCGSSRIFLEEEGLIVEKDMDIDKYKRGLIRILGEIDKKGLVNIIKEYYNCFIVEQFQAKQLINQTQWFRLFIKRIIDIKKFLNIQPNQSFISNQFLNSHQSNQFLYKIHILNIHPYLNFQNANLNSLKHFFIQILNIIFTHIINKDNNLQVITIRNIRNYNPENKRYIIPQKIINKCLQLIFQSKHSRSQSSQNQQIILKSSRNAITLLSSINYMFQDLDFSHIQIADADISNSIFHRVQFEQANLNNCIIKQTLFLNCNFLGAAITNLKTQIQSYQKNLYFDSENGFLIQLQNLFIIFKSFKSRQIIKKISITKDIYSSRQDFIFIQNLIISSNYKSLVIMNYEGKHLIYEVSDGKKQKYIRGNTILISDYTSKLSKLCKLICYSLKDFERDIFEIQNINMNEDKNRIFYYKKCLYFGHKNEVYRYNSSSNRCICVLSVSQVITNILVGCNKGRDDSILFVLGFRELYIYDLDKKQEIIMHRFSQILTKIQDMYIIKENVIALKNNKKIVLFDWIQAKVILNLNQNCKLYYYDGQYIKIDNQSSSTYIKTIKIQQSSFKEKPNKSIVKNIQFISNQLFHIFLTLNHIFLQCKITLNKYTIKLDQNTKLPFIQFNKSNTLFLVIHQTNLNIYSITSIQNIPTFEPFKFIQYKSFLKTQIILANFDSINNLYIISSDLIVVFSYPYEKSTVISKQNKKQLIYNTIKFVGQNQLDCIAIDNANFNLNIYNKQLQKTYSMPCGFLKDKKNKQIYNKNRQIYNKNTGIYTLEINEFKAQFKFLGEKQRSRLLNFSEKKPKILKKRGENEIMYINNDRELIYEQYNIGLNIRCVIVGNIDYCQIFEKQIYVIASHTKSILSLQILNKNNLAVIISKNIKNISQKIYSLQIFENYIIIANMERQVFLFNVKAIKQDPSRNLQYKKLDFTANIKFSHFYNSNYILLDHFSKITVYNQDFSQKILEKNPKKSIIKIHGKTPSNQYIYYISGKSSFNIFDCKNLKIQQYKDSEYMLLEYAKQIKIDNSGRLCLVLYKCDILIVFDLKERIGIRKMILNQIQNVSIDSNNIIFGLNNLKGQNVFYVQFTQKVENRVQKIEDEQIQMVKYMNKAKILKLTNLQIDKKQMHSKIPFKDCQIESGKQFILNQYLY